MNFNHPYLILWWQYFLFKEGDDALVQDRGRTGAKRGIFHLSKNKNNPRPGQNLVLKIDSTGANYSTK